MSFKLWSELNEEAQKILKPDFGLRTWDKLSPDERKSVWKYLEGYFFDCTPRYDFLPAPFDPEMYFDFSPDPNGIKPARIVFAISELNNRYKAKGYAKAFLQNRSLVSACLDFYSIFITESDAVVLELISLYCKSIIMEANKNPNRNKVAQESEEDYQQYLDAF